MIHSNYDYEPHRQLGFLTFIYAESCSNLSRSQRDYQNMDDCFFKREREKGELVNHVPIRALNYFLVHRTS
jgi:hypothetical protein